MLRRDSGCPVLHRDPQTLASLASLRAKGLMSVFPSSFPVLTQRVPSSLPGRTPPSTRLDSHLVIESQGPKQPPLRIRIGRQPTDPEMRRVWARGEPWTAPREPAGRRAFPGDQWTPQDTGCARDQDTGCARDQAPGPGGFFRDRLRGFLGGRGLWFCLDGKHRRYGNAMTSGKGLPWWCLGTPPFEPRRSEVA